MATKRRRRRRKSAKGRCIVRVVCGRKMRICFRKNGKIYSNTPVSGARRRRRRKRR